MILALPGLFSYFFYSTRRFALSLAFLLLFCLVLFFTPFSIAITSLGEERANLSAFRTFVRFGLFVLSVFSSSWCLGVPAACDFCTP